MEARRRWNTRSAGAHLLGGAVLVVGSLVCAGCPDEAPGAAPDTGGPPPGDYDGGFLAPGWPDGPRCDASLQELPMTGGLSWHSTMSLWEPYVVYSRWGPSTRGDDVFLYDLERCRETQLTYREGEQAAASIWDGEVLFHDYLSPIRWYSEQWVSQLVSFDLTTQRPAFLTPVGKLFSPSHNGRFVLYYWAYPSSHCCDQIDYALALWDRQDDVHQTLSWGHYPTTEAVISAGYVAWLKPNGVGAFTEYDRIDYLDLETGESTTLASSLLAPPTALALGDDWLLWTDERSGGPNVHARHLPSGLESTLTDDGHLHQRPTVRGRIACWRTDRYAGGVPDHWDLLLHDLETGVQRRLTEESAPGWPVGLVHRRWAIFTRGEIDAPDLWYALHLPSAGLMDADGSLIPE